MSQGSRQSTSIEAFDFQYQMLYTAKVAILFSFAATVISVLALLGGIDAPVVRNIPWLYGKLYLNSTTVGSARADLWNACLQMGNKEECGTLSSFSHLFGAANSDQIAIFERHAVSLPYTQISACVLIALSLVSSFGPVAIALGITSMAAVMQLGSFISATVFFSHFASPFTTRVKIPFFGGFFLCFTSCILMMFSVGWLVAAHVQDKRKKKYYDY